VARAQKALALHVDDHLGYLQTDEVYSVRELSPYKEPYPLDELSRRPQRAERLAEEWGRILAMAHARADDDFDPERVPHSIEAQVTRKADGRHDAFEAIVGEVAWEWHEHMVTSWERFVPWVEEEYDFDCSEGT